MDTEAFISRETTIDYQPVTILPCISNTTITATNCISVIYIRDIIVLVANKIMYDGFSYDLM